MSNLTPRLNRLDRNYLINSDKSFAQRSTAAENLTASYEFNSLDRHAYKTAGTFNGTPTIQRVQDSPDGKTKYCSEFVADFAAATSELFEAQPIESVNSRDLVGENVSYSIWVKSTSCTTLELRLYTADVEDDFTAVTSFYSQAKTIVADGNWQRVVFENIPMALGAERGVLLETVLTDSDTTGATESVRLTRGKLNIGKTAQDWNLFGLDYADELNKCQRYYEKSYNLDVNPGSISTIDQYTWTSVNPSNSIQRDFEFKVIKRANSTSTPYNPSTGASGSIRNNTAASNVAVGSSASERILRIGNPSVTEGSSVSAHWTADSEVAI